ncbi:Mor transcription activator family protein [Variovorax sp. J22R203]|uniref:Mor transcription activator family protein n=1 Tax=unclassified Variovorax TaxID=663243 RepID=UPI002574D8C3|nr:MULTISPECIES: Mor transcription activator family protein [unclassified Variovorax]MDM0003900.1 Mor transcription activator family protein [Variovorax sp. J22R203]
MDHVFAYLLREFPHLAGPQFAKAKRALREHLAGERVYVAARGSGDRAALAREVLSLFNGRNATEVARSLSISRATVYRLLKQTARRS